MEDELQLLTEIIRAWDEKMPSAKGPLVRADFLELAVILAPLIRQARRLIAHPTVELPQNWRERDHRG